MHSAWVCCHVRRVAAICTAAFAAHFLYLGGCFAAVGRVPKKVAAADLIPRQAEFCQELKHRGFAIVQSDLSRRKEALAWLEGLAETDPDLADFGLSSDDDGLVRYQRVDFPRTVQRLDVTPAGSGALADPGAKHHASKYLWWARRSWTLLAPGSGIADGCTCRVMAGSDGFSLS